MTKTVTYATFYAGEDCAFRVRRLQTGLRKIYGVDLIDTNDGHQLPLGMQMFHTIETALNWASEQAKLARRGLETLTVSVEA